MNDNRKAILLGSTKLLLMFLIISVALLATSVHATPKTLMATDPTLQKGNKKMRLTGSVFINLDQMPHFPGGNASMFSYIRENLKYPQIAQRKGIQGRVVIGFVVRKDGSIENVALVKGISKQCDVAAMRVIKDMPNWSPCIQDGEKVDMRFTIPILFALEK